QIRAEIENSDSDYDREKLQERLAKLAGGVAVIKAGAATEVELKETKHRIEDAVRNAKAAVEEGIVAGGGVSLIQAGKAAFADLEPVFGLNAVTGGYEDLLAAGINDPVKVTRSALQNAASIAGLFLTTESVVADKPEKAAAGADAAAGMDGMGGMGGMGF